MGRKMSMVTSSRFRIRQLKRRSCGHQPVPHLVLLKSSGAKVLGISEALKLQMKEELMMVSLGPHKGNLIAERIMTTIYLEGQLVDLVGPLQYL